jgi:hypothetical protein
MKLSDYSLSDIMHLPLPTITEQKLLLYRPTYKDALHVYSLLNEQVFSNELAVPNINIRGRRKKYWGMCVAEHDLEQPGTYCHIELMDKWYCPQWFVTTIAHEMAHQHQWDIEGPKRVLEGKNHLMSHGPTFFRFRDKLEKHYIPLKTAHSMRKWFKYQDLFKT